MWSRSAGYSADFWGAVACHSLAIANAHAQLSSTLAAEMLHYIYYPILSQPCCFSHNPALHPFHCVVSLAPCTPSPSLHYLPATTLRHPLPLPLWLLLVFIQRAMAGLAAPHRQEKQDWGIGPHSQGGSECST